MCFHKKNGMYTNSYEKHKYTYIFKYLNKQFTNKPINLYFRLEMKVHRQLYCYKAHYLCSVRTCMASNIV